MDTITGPLIGRAKSATYRTADVVGIDTIVKVAQGVKSYCPDDEANASFEIPDWLERMVAEKKLGSKTKEGFFKKVKGEDGKSQILGLNLDTFEYEPTVKANFPSVAMVKPMDDLKDRLKALNKGQDKASQSQRRFSTAL